MPPVHVHCFSEHSRSLVALSSLDSYWCSLHTVCEAHVPANAALGGSAMYSLASHSLTSVHVATRAPSSWNSIPGLPHMKPGLCWVGYRHEWLLPVLHRARLLPWPPA